MTSLYTYYAHTRKLPEPERVLKYVAFQWAGVIRTFPVKQNAFAEHLLGAIDSINKEGAAFSRLLSLLHINVEDEHLLPPAALFPLHRSPHWDENGPNSDTLYVVPQPFGGGPEVNHMALQSPSNDTNPTTCNATKPAILHVRTPSISSATSQITFPANQMKNSPQRWRWQIPVFLLVGYIGGTLAPHVNARVFSALSAAVPAVASLIGHW